MLYGQKSLSLEPWLIIFPFFSKKSFCSKQHDFDKFANLEIKVKVPWDFWPCCTIYIWRKLPWDWSHQQRRCGRFCSHLCLIRFFPADSLESCSVWDHAVSFATWKKNILGLCLSCAGFHHKRFRITRIALCMALEIAVERPCSSRFSQFRTHLLWNPVLISRDPREAVCGLKRKCRLSADCVQIAGTSLKHPWKSCTCLPWPWFLLFPQTRGIGIDLQYNYSHTEISIS